MLRQRYPVASEAMSTALCGTAAFLFVVQGAQRVLLMKQISTWTLKGRPASLIGGTAIGLAGAL
jgi:hypothetical protein